MAGLEINRLAVLGAGGMAACGLDGGDEPVAARLLETVGLTFVPVGIR